MSGGLAAEGRERRVAAAKEALADRLGPAGWDEARHRRPHRPRCPPSYWLAFDAGTHAYQAELMAQGRARRATSSPSRRGSIPIAASPR